MSQSVRTLKAYKDLVFVRCVTSARPLGVQLRFCETHKVFRPSSRYKRALFFIVQFTLSDTVNVSAYLDDDGRQGHLWSAVNQTAGGCTVAE
jgi:hypothetical protein